MRRSHRSLIAGLALALSVALGASACSSPAPDPGDSNEEVSFEGMTLRFATFGGTWAGFVKKYIGDPFEAATGARIEYIAGNPGDNYAKLLAAQGTDPGFDLGTFSDIHIESLVEREFIQKIDLDLAPNVAGAYDEATIVEGYTPALTWYRLAFGYNTEKFEAAGIPAPTDWEDFWDPRLDGRIAVPGSTTSMAVPTLIVANQLEGEKDLKNLEPGFEKLSELNVNQVYASSSAADASVVAGDVWAWATTPGRVRELQKQDIPVDLVYPKLQGKEGVVVRDVSMQIPASVDEKTALLAQAFLDYHFDPERIASLAQDSGTEPTIPAAVAILEKNEALKGRYITPDNIDTVYFPDLNVLVPQLPEVLDRWSSLFIK